MANFPTFEPDGSWIESLRGDKNTVDPWKPYSFSTEKELTLSGRIETVNTIFLTNRECPYHCLMCDLWKNTTDKKVPSGAIPAQIELALSNLPPAKHIKLYNSGSFFDTAAIPLEDYPNIASLLSEYETVIVENHPRLTSDHILTFRDLIKGQLQVALGLETTHPEVLKRLNKKMTLDDFTRSTQWLNKNKIPIRAFILLKPPFMSYTEGIHWAKHAIGYALDAGAASCVIIPTRSGNGAMEWLEQNEYFSPPDIQALEEVVEFGIKQKKGQVFADLWDIELFSNCDKCLDKRKNRLEQMNLKQSVSAPVNCTCLPVTDDT